MFTGFLALGSDAWWTVKGVGSSSILNVRVSPFYVQINALGAPPTVPNAFVLGSTTRILLAMTTIALALISIFPRSVWRKPVYWLGMSSLIEVFVSFAFLVHATQVTILNTYGTIPPLAGNTIIPGRVLGLDLTSYQNPSLSSNFAPAFYIGLISVTVLGGSGIIYYLLHPQKLEFLSSEFLRGLSGVYLSPPYQHAWFTSTDQGLNPLGEDPDNLTDDELAMSFEKLLDKMQPGGLVSVILPAWASGLNDRLARVLPWTGFHLEKSELIYRVPGKPENELVFRKPVNVRRVQQLQELDELSTPIPILEVPSIGTEQPPVVEVIEEPVWAEPRMSRRELAMVKSAVSVIERRKEPVPYKELLNDVYMELLDRKVDFESARQIETTLLKHAEKELTILEDMDETGSRVLKKWWLGERLLRAERPPAGPGIWTKLSLSKMGIPKIKQLFGKLQRHQHEGYKPRKQIDED
jgi:hypothetical protein